MADRVGTNVLLNQERHKIIQFWSVSDGTGESEVVKVSKAVLNGPHSGPIKINKIDGVVSGMAVNIFFDATADDLICVLPDGHDSHFDFTYCGGLKDPQSSGNVGDILFTTVGHTNLDSYMIVIDFIW